MQTLKRRCNKMSTEKELKSIRQNITKDHVSHSR
jgi:hypothetical protein